MKECGTEATVRQSPTDKHWPHFQHPVGRESAGSALWCQVFPGWCKCCPFSMISPKEKNQVLSMLSSVSSLALTVSPAFISYTSLRISMVPLEIFLVMSERGPLSVQGGHSDLTCRAIASALEAASILLARSMSLTVMRFSLVNTKLIFPLIRGNTFPELSCSNSWHLY